MSDKCTDCGCEVKLVRELGLYYDEGTKNWHTPERCLRNQLEQKEKEIENLRRLALEVAKFTAGVVGDLDIRNTVLKAQLFDKSEQIIKLQATVDKLRVIIKPFAHPDLCKSLQGNANGDDSIIFQRDNATITLGNCRDAAKENNER